MRFKTGDKVEVMNDKDVPVSWCTAKILSRSGNNYTIQYDCFPGMASKQLVKMVPRKFVRPRPSLRQDVKSFIMGDTVEIFHQHSWRIAIVLNVLGGKRESKRNKIRCKVSTFKNQYLVKLIGCSKELAIDRSNIRTRQIWHDGKWITMGKIHQVGHDVTTSKPSTLDFFQKMNFQNPQFDSQAKYQYREDCRNIQNDATQRESAVISSKSLKRMSPYVSSIAEANNGHAQKFRAAEKEGQKQRVVADQVLEKVDAVAYPKETLGETYMHASYNINGYNQMEREKQNDVLGYSGIRGSEINSSDSDACSVGSCSVTNQGLKNYYNHSMLVNSQETDTLCSDAESSYGAGSERKSSSFPLKEKVEGYSWRHASLASNGLKMMPGFAAFLLALNFGRFSRLLSETCYGYGHSLVSDNLCYLNLFLLFLPGLIGCIRMSLPEESICNCERAICNILTILEICVSIENRSSDNRFFTNLFVLTVYAVKQ